MSKNCKCLTLAPAATAPVAKFRACPCTRSAIFLSPAGPCHAAYMPAITAKSTCAVQMLLVAFSRRMCCSRVCKARRSAVAPSASTLTPTSRPGIMRSSPRRRLMKPACGPPKPIGTPKRCAEPMAISAPYSPGDFSKQSDNRSQANVTSAPRACALSTAGVGSKTRPSEPGYEISSPKYSMSALRAATSSMLISSNLIPSGSARTCITASVCG